MWTEILIFSVITVVFGVFGTLAWWKLADRWVSEEHRRFKSKPTSPTPGIVIKNIKDEP